MSEGYQAFISVGCFSAMGLVILWFLGGLFENYKRVVIFLLLQRLDKFHCNEFN